MFEGDPFKGKTWAITGAVPGMTRSEAFAELKKRGAKATKSVSSKTDVLVSQGYDPGDRVRLSNKEIKARQNDIPIINEKQFLALLKGEALEAVESMAPVAKPRKTVSTTDALVGFREIVHDEPSIKTWNTICELVDACEPDDLPVVIDYLDGHLSSWPVTYDVNYAEYYRSGMLSLPLS
ncbi:MAG: BRCT domain-containing protein, partial [Myxococcota bacterium]